MKVYSFYLNVCTSVHFWVFGALWCPETLKWAYLGNQLSVRDEPKNTFYRRRWPTDRAIFYGPRTPDQKVAACWKSITHPFSERHPTKYDVPLSAPAIPTGRMAIDDDFAPGLNLFGPFCPILPLLQDSTAQRKWKNEQSINCMSGPTKWPPVPLWDRETCGGVRMATALIVVPGSRVWICYPALGCRSAHWKIYEIKSAQKYILFFVWLKK